MVKPLIEALVPVTVIFNVPFRYTSYSVTPTLSVDAFHEIVNPVPEMLLEDRAVGVVGASVSRVVTLRALLGKEVFPAASFAVTVMLKEVPLVKPLIEALVPVTVVINVPFRYTS